MAPNTSAVWRYFSKKSIAGVDEMMCLLCEYRRCKNCSREAGPCRLKGHFSTNGKKHLSSAHQSEYTEVVKADEQLAIKRGLPKKDNLPTPTTGQESKRAKTDFVKVLSFNFSHIYICLPFYLATKFIECFGPTEVESLPLFSQTVRAFVDS